eukprot:TRINITY_DN13705_c0_g1_i1.p1 TRINITY_DN13705_c0_g1~~TRINITY_DN13705_c0_g1_i1.p1  ORF type:complete len:271 (-),score=53.61 TRINITY_DN13705_c0_g1_i1:139-951(-)
MLEALTPFAPGYFLPLAAVANIGKNISWLAASATKASFHLSFSLKANLADVTAKAGSQAVVASTLGTAVGISLSAGIGAETCSLLGMLVLLSIGHLGCTARALQEVALNTLNQQRAELLAKQFLSHQDRLSCPQELAQQDSLGAWCSSRLHSGFVSQIVVGPLLEQLVAGQDVDSCTAHLEEHGYFLEQIKQPSRDRPRMGLVILETATSHHVLDGILQAVHATQREPGVGDTDGHRFIAKLQDAGWNTNDIFIEEYMNRVSIDLSLIHI